MTLRRQEWIALAAALGTALLVSVGVWAGPTTQGKTIVSDQSSGSNAIAFITNGARLDLGTASTDYLASDGIGVFAPAYMYIGNAAAAQFDVMAANGNSATLNVRNVGTANLILKSDELNSRRYLRANSSSATGILSSYFRPDNTGGIDAMRFGQGPTDAAALGFQSYTNTSGNKQLATFEPTFLPASGTGNFVTLQVNPTVNGTSSGIATALAVASKTNTLTGGTVYLLDIGTTSTDYFTGYTQQFAVQSSGKQLMPTTDSTGTPGAATIDKPSGKSAIAAGAQTVVITNALVTAASGVQITLIDVDATCPIPKATPGAGSFTVTGTSVSGVATNCTATTKFMWRVYN